MLDKLLTYYENELQEFDDLAEHFSRKYPEAAGYLVVDPNNEAPHVSRLIQGIALLNAGMKRKLDDEMPGVDNALLAFLYPHFEMPIPSAAIIQCLAKDGLTKQFIIPKNSLLETSPEDGDICCFRTCYDNYILPVEVVDACLLHDKSFVPKLPPSVNAQSVLRLELRCTDNDIRFSQLEVDKLRFFLSGPSNHTHKIYEMLFNDTATISITTADDIANPLFISNKNLAAVGFTEEETLLVDSKRSFSGYRLLTEFSIFPEKFLFFDIKNLSSHIKNCGNNLVLHFFFNSTQEDVDFTIDKDNFMLGCTPLINLFTRNAEPIQLTGKTYEYPVIADARNPYQYEICQVTKAVVLDSNGKEAEYMPFFGIEHADDSIALGGYYHTTRTKHIESAEGGDEIQSDLHISFVNQDGSPLLLNDLVTHMEILCSNGLNVRKLFLGGNIPKLQFVNSGAPIANVTWAVSPTPYHIPILASKTQKIIMSHLALNHSSLLDKNGAGLKNLLDIYDFGDNQIIKKAIHSIMQVNAHKIVRFLPDNAVTAAVQGNEIKLILSDIEIANSNLYLFLFVIYHFLTLYSSINSFVELSIICYRRGTEIYRWQPKLGWGSTL